MNEAIRMQLSAFVDGELPENESELLLRRLSQDAELRQQVAEYLAIGRAMRGDVQVAGIDQLRDRLFAELGQKLGEKGAIDVAETKDVIVRPLTGVAIAATVALVAIFGLQKMSGPDDTEPLDPVVAGVAVDALPTEPPLDDVLDQYRMMHNVSALERGANSFKPLIQTVEFRQESVQELESERDETPTDTEEDAVDNMPPGSSDDTEFNDQT